MVKSDCFADMVRERTSPSATETELWAVFPSFSTPDRVALKVGTRSVGRGGVFLFSGVSRNIWGWLCMVRAARKHLHKSFANRIRVWIDWRRGDAWENERRRQKILQHAKCLGRFIISIFLCCLSHFLPCLSELSPLFSLPVSPFAVFVWALLFALPVSPFAVLFELSPLFPLPVSPFAVLC